MNQKELCLSSYLLNIYLLDTISQKREKSVLVWKAGVCQGRQDPPLEWKNLTHFPPNYYKFEIKGISGKDMGKE